MPRDTDATVLLIEADSEAVAEYADWLEGYAVRTAADGERALDALDALAGHVGRPDEGHRAVTIGFRTVRWVPL